MSSETKTTTIKDVLLKNKLNQITVIFVLALSILYVVPIFPEQSLAEFSRRFSDAIFLGIVITAIFFELRKTDSLVDPIYWILLGSAYIVWFAISLFKISLWHYFSTTTQQTLNELAYFLHFSLVIAAIEVKSYAKASHLLALPNILIWGSSLSFTLGAFIFLVLTVPTNSANEQASFSLTFMFYLVMNLYIALRWFHLALRSKHAFWQSYALFGFASLNWFIADGLEGLSYTSYLNLAEGTLIDWIWFTPYLLLLFAIRSPVNQLYQASNASGNQSHFSTIHLLNSPLFFAVSCLLIKVIIESNGSLFGPLNANQQNFFEFWLYLSLFLASIQFYLLIRSKQDLELNLLSLEKSTEALKLKMAEQAQSLKEQAASNQAILETTHNAIFTLDFRDQILSCNPAACDLIGKKQASLIGSSFIESVDAQGELAKFFTYQSYRQRIEQSDKGIELEASIINQSGEILPVHATISPSTNNDNGLLVVSLINIQEQKQAEEEAHNLKDQFTQNISHEFRTPLTIINGVVDNLLSHQTSANDKTQLQTAKRNVLRMTRMVEQLLELSRIANDPIKLVPINLASVLKFVCTSFEEIAKSQNLEFKYSIPKEAFVIGNNNAAEKILFNLISNAFKYTPQGKIKVHLNHLEKRFCLTISDTGLGIAASDVKHIFDRFHRVDSKSTERIQGAGIGLALVKELCNSMRWDIQVESKLNQGTSFSITVEAIQMDNYEVSENTVETSQPISHNTIQNIELELIDSKSQINTKPLQKSEYSILIVEDNPDMLSHINGILAPHHHCLLADNGEEGLRLAMDYLPDIIISDVMMPGIDGFQLLKTLKKTDMTSHIPVILLTARSDTQSKIKGLEYEADDYLSKPFDATELALRINNQLQSRQKLQQRLVNQLQNDEVSTNSPVKDKFIEKLEGIYAKNYHNSDFSVLELASQLAMSDRQVQRKIKSLLGVSPLEALKQFRLKQAKSRLQAGEQIGVVAQSCGFTSQSYFGRCFKESFGITPKQYQQRN